MISRGLQWATLGNISKGSRGCFRATSRHRKAPPSMGTRRGGLNCLVGAAGMGIVGNTRRRNRGEALKRVDHSLTAKTSQPSFHGNPCTRCGSTLRLQSDSRCVRCLRQWRRDNEHRYYRRYGGKLFRQLGITPADFYMMAENQDWACKICGRIPEGKLHVDHCHTSGNIRGLLCGGCNVGLGHFNDDPERLAAAIEYLRTC